MASGELQRAATPWWTRDEVIAAIEDLGQTFVTTWWNTYSKEWEDGAEVGVVRPAGRPYLRTDSNLIAQDNLGELMQFPIDVDS